MKITHITGVAGSGKTELLRLASAHYGVAITNDREFVKQVPAFLTGKVEMPKVLLVDDVQLYAKARVFTDLQTLCDCFGDDYFAIVVTEA